MKKARTNMLVDALFMGGFRRSTRRIKYLDSRFRGNDIWVGSAVPVTTTSVIVIPAKAGIQSWIHLAQ